MTTVGKQIGWVVLGAVGLWWIAVGAIANWDFAVSDIGLLRNGVLFFASLLAIVTFAVKLADDDESLWNALKSSAHRFASRTPFVDPQPIVEGAIAHDSVVWVCKRFHNGDFECSHRACPSCQLELIERHTTTSELTPEIITDGGETVNALSCPHCTFAIRGQKHEPSGENAALSKFKAVVAEMRDSGREGIKQWERTARNTIGTEPTAADVWDEYLKSLDTSSDSPVRRRTATLSEGGSRQTIDTYPAFDRLRRSRGVREDLVELLPEPLDVATAEVVRTDYLDRKATLKEQRERARKAYQDRRAPIHREHQDTLTSLTKACTDRTWPEEYSDAEFERLADDIESFASLRSERERFLTGAERKNIRRHVRQFEKAQAYYRQATELRATLETAQTAVTTFESAFEPYRDFDTYLESAAEDRLRALLIEAETAVNAMGETLDSALVPVPTDASKQLDEFTTLVQEYHTQLDEHESRFVAHEVETYPDIFETDYGPLNEQQTLAVVRNDPYNLVDASAGTGKTLTLARRFLYLYEKGTALDDLVAITFTSDAAEEMKQRVAETAGHLGASRLNFMTYHALARDICSQAMTGEIDRQTLHNGMDRFLERAFTVDSELQQLAPEAMETFLEHRRQLPKTDPEEFTSKDSTIEAAADERIQSVFETARNFDRTAEEIRARTDQGDMLEYHVAHAVAALLELYTALADQREHPIDHDHSIERATELVKAYPGRHVGRYNHILVDEFQDVSRRELDFIQALLGPESHLFAVGDDWQSIYGFRGSKPAFFREFESRFEETSRTTLEVNYRCPPAVVQTGSAVMLNSDEATTKEARAHSSVETTPVLHQLTGPYTDRLGAYIAERIEDLVDDEAVYAEVMILTRNDDDVQKRIRSHLEVHGIPTEASTSDSSTGAVTVQTAHSAKGTEAPYVFVANAADNQYDGFPQNDRQDRGEGPVVDNNVTHSEEERRLFYVAVTRAEEELHVIAQAGAVSQFVESIDSQFAVVNDRVMTVEGKLTTLEFNSGRPNTITIDCGSYEAHLMSWDDDPLFELEEGSVYRFDDLQHQPNGYDEDLEITDESSFRRVQ